MTGAADEPEASEPSSFKQTIVALPGSRVHTTQHGDMYVGPGSDKDGSPLRRLREISESAVADCDVVALRGGRSVVRFGDGAYVRRSVEDRLLRRLTRPSVTAVVGEAGHGKTALMWQLHRRLAALGRDPLLVPASLLLDGPSGPGAVSVEMISEALREGGDGWPAVLLVDTLDLLLHDPATRERVARLLAAAERARVPTLVTSRPVEAHALRLVDLDQHEAAPPAGQLGKVTVHGYDHHERDEAISAYARLFYSPAEAAEVKRVLDGASVRGRPLQEICRNPLSLRLLFEIYAPDEMPPPDIDSIGLHEEYWRRRVSTDERGRHIASRARDLTREAEGAALALLSGGSIDAPRPELVDRVRILTTGGAPDQGGTAAAMDELHARGVLKTPPNSGRLRFFHQTFFEHAAARSVLALGDDGVRVLLDRVHEDPHDLFYGEVAAQLVLLAERRPVLSRRPVAVLPGWLESDERALRILALRTYARMPDPPRELRDVAAAALDGCEVDAAGEYLRLVPSVRHRSFERVRDDLGILWRRAVLAPDERPLALAVIEALARMAPVHPDGVHDFVTGHGCVSWLMRLPRTYWRNNDSGYLRLLEPLYSYAPRSWGPVLTEFFARFCAESKPNAAAEIVEMLNRYPALPLSRPSADVIIAEVHRFVSDESAERLEIAYAEWRVAWFTGADVADLAARTSAVFGETRFGVGQRAELRALCRAALRLSEDDARSYLDGPTAETDRMRQEHVCTLLGEILAVRGAPAAPLTRLARESCRRELARLPARRHGDGSRPLPVLFVQALYGARVGGDELLAALPDDPPADLWTHPDGLMALLTPAALAGHPDALEALGASLREPAPGDASAARVRKAVLGRLHKAVEQRVPGALDHLIDHADASGDVTELCAVLLRSETAGGQPLAVHRHRLDALRVRLVSSGDPGVNASGYKLWRMLVEQCLGASPEPAQLAAALRRRPGYPLLIRLLELGHACLRSGRWFGDDVGVLADELRPYLSRDEAGRLRVEGSTVAAEQASTVETQARRLLIGLYARHVPLGTSAVQRREQAGRVLAFARDAGYDVRDIAEFEALTGCVIEAGRLVERVGDPVTVIELILDTAAWLRGLGAGSVRWRQRIARAWSPAITRAVTGVSTAECHGLVENLLESNPEMARQAVAACVDHLRPVPAWLQDLTAEMPPETRKRMREVLSRNRRDGSERSLADLYAVAAGRGRPER